MAKRRRLRPSQRHALKEDRFVETTIEAVHWSRRHLPIMVGVLLAAALLAAAAVIVSRGRTAAEVAAWDSLFWAAPGTPEAAPAPKGSSARPWLLLRGADSLLREGKPEEAARAYQELLDEHPIKPVAAQARIGLGHALVSLGKWKDAADQFGRPVVNDSYFRPEAIWSQAFCQEKLGDRRAAEAAYKSLRNEFPGTVWADLAEFRLAQQGFGVEPAEDAQPG